MAVGAEIRRRLFSVEEYHRMAQAGVFGEDDRLELIEGEIVEMAPIGSRHAACVDRLNRLFSTRVAEQATVRVQSPIRLGDWSEPQPDVALLRPRQDFYASAHPGPEDVLLVVEVAETSAAYDREVKVPLYARHGVPEVWLVDLGAEVVEVFRRPSKDGYLEVQTARRGEKLSPRLLPEESLAVEEVLA